MILLLKSYYNIIFMYYDIITLYTYLLVILPIILTIPRINNDIHFFK